MKKELALLLKHAAELHEGSFDHDKANELINQDPPMFGLASDLCYRKPLHDACMEAEKLVPRFEGMGELAYMLLRGNWNEALEWSAKALEEKQKS